MAAYSRYDQLSVSLDRSAPSSLPSQLVEQIRGLIASGHLTPGDPLPSTRSLAERLNVSRGTVVFAYEQLVGEGYIVSSRGGTQVAAGANFARLPQDQGLPGSNPLRGRPEPAPSPSDQGVIDLRPGQPDTSLVATASWRAAWRAAAAQPGLTYPAAGSLELRYQLVEHLRMMRSVLREPDDLLVTAGARDGFRLVLTLLRRRVRNRPLRIAVEEPGFPSLHRIPLAFGHEILPMPVDSQGLNPAHLPSGEGRPDLVLVAPSHQYPLGASLPLARRLELLAWAQDSGAFIVEDDYDSELRYVGDPLPALASLDRPSGRPGLEAHPANWSNDRVITLGSFAKMLAPGLNLGFVLLPRHLRSAALELREDTGNPVSSISQQAMTHFLAAGGLRRHTARMRRVYRARRQLLLEELTGVRGIRVLPMDGGLHAVLELTRGSASLERDLLARSRQAGLLLAPLGAYWSTRGQGQVGAGPMYGLVLGFGGVSDRQLLQGLALLKEVLKS